MYQCFHANRIRGQLFLKRINLQPPKPPLPCIQPAADFLRGCQQHFNKAKPQSSSTHQVWVVPHLLVSHWPNQVTWLLPYPVWSGNTEIGRGVIQLHNNLQHMLKQYNYLFLVISRSSDEIHSAKDFYSSFHVKSSLPRNTHGSLFTAQQKIPRVHFSHLPSASFTYTQFPCICFHCCCK